MWYKEVKKTPFPNLFLSPPTGYNCVFNKPVTLLFLYRSISWSLDLLSLPFLPASTTASVSQLQILYCCLCISTSTTKLPAGEEYLRLSPCPPCKVPLKSQRLSESSPHNATKPHDTLCKPLSFLRFEILVPIPSFCLHLLPEIAQIMYLSINSLSLFQKALQPHFLASFK